MRLVHLLSLVALTLLLAGAVASAARGDRSTAPTTQPTDEQLHIASFDNADEVREFLQKLQCAEAKGDREAIVSFVRFPFTRYSHGKVQKRYKSKSELLSDFDKVFTTQVLGAMRRDRFETLFFRDQGAMIGDGEVWFYKQEGKIAVKAVNP